MEWVKAEFACREPGTNRLRDNNGGILLRYCIECPALKIGQCLRADPDKIKSDLAEAIAERDGKAERPPARRQRICRHCHKNPVAANRAWCRSCIEKGHVHNRQSRARAKPSRMCAWPSGCEKTVRAGTYCRSHAAMTREKQLRIARLLKKVGG